jgi:hypothetical protein
MPPSDKNPNWMTVSALADRLGISKQSLSERICRMEERQQLQTKRQGREKLVDADEFDRVSAQTHDAVRTLNGSTAKRRHRPQPAAKPARSDSRRPLEGAGNVLAQEQARRASYSADMLKLALDERLGQVLARRDVENAMVDCATALTRVINKMPEHADALAAAVAKDGAAGARRALKEFGLNLRTELAAEMKLLIAGGAGSDPRAAQRRTGTHVENALGSA